MELSIMSTYHPHLPDSRFVITDEFMYDNQQSVRELINLRDSYVIWARKLSIVSATSDEYATTRKDQLTAVPLRTSIEAPDATLLATKERINLPLFPLRTSIEAPDATLLATKERINLPLFPLRTSIEAFEAALITKVEEQRAHLTPVDLTPKETVPSDTTLKSPSKRTLKKLRLKTDKKRLIDDDGFQTPDKKHTARKISKKNPSLPPTTSQTSNPAQGLPSPAESSDSEIEDENAGKSNTTAVGTPKKPNSTNFCHPS
ncbi:hypothetical protein TNCV_1660021 [Trichonephila clavipes]|nr:hypothetical protein TNCV_1660021 [Trichonephila clavipes]